MTDPVMQRLGAGCAGRIERSALGLIGRGVRGGGRAGGPAAVPRPALPDLTARLTRHHLHGDRE